MFRNVSPAGRSQIVLIPIFPDGLLGENRGGGGGGGDRRVSELNSLEERNYTFANAKRLHRGIGIFHRVRFLVRSKYKNLGYGSTILAPIRRGRKIF